jgi:hypothetical protein
VKYSDRQKFLVHNQLDAHQQVQQLEQIETHLVSKLKHTHAQQQNAYKELQDVVKEGY